MVSSPWLGATPPLHPNVRGISDSPTVASSALCKRLRAEGRTVFELGLGQSPFPVPASVVEALRANAGRKDYLAVQGLPELRAAVADYHRRRDAAVTRPELVLVGPGSKELMFLLQIVCDAELVVPTPAWVSYAPQARIAGRRVRFLQTSPRTQWRLLPDVLDELCRREPGPPRLLVLNYPGNPTGVTYEPSELEQLAAVASRHGLVILSDEIYAELRHDGAHASIARYYPEGTIVSSGLSKWCGAGGWRLGTFAFPPQLAWLLAAMTAVASETYTSTSAPIQFAAVRAFAGGVEIERYLRNVRRILSALCGLLVERLRDAGVDLVVPAGAFYLFPAFQPLADKLRKRGVTSGEELSRRLLADTGVATLPGSAFGRAAEELTLRLACVDFDGAKALAAAEAVPADRPVDRAFVAAHCGPVVAAVERLCAWLQ